MGLLDGTQEIETFHGSLIAYRRMLTKSCELLLRLGVVAFGYFDHFTTAFGS